MKHIAKDKENDKRRHIHDKVLDWSSQEAPLLIKGMKGPRLYFYQECGGCSIISSYQNHYRKECPWSKCQGGPTLIIKSWGASCEL